jgi:hypothetical protein
MIITLQGKFITLFHLPAVLAGLELPVVLLLVESVLPADRLPVG